MTAFAPGRVNLLGEHTDYNDGLALPFAIGPGVTVRAEPIAAGELHVHAVDLARTDSFPLADPGRVGGWRAFARGLAAELQAEGCRLRGARLEVTGTVPRGSGLSSSAALEVALCLAMLGVSGEPEPDRVRLARICSRVENEWVGAQTGLLDQLASLFGAAERGLRIDFRTLAVTPVPLTLGDFRLVVLDSAQRHANAGGGAEEGGYNQRRRECAAAARALGLNSLRDATAAMAESLAEPLGRRVRHVVSENERVEQATAALAGGDFARLGELLDASHASLRDDFEVSTPAVEAAIGRLRAAGAIGARIIGGGFGGHVLGLLSPDTPVPEHAQSVAPSAGAWLAP